MCVTAYLNFSVNSLDNHSGLETDESQFFLLDAAQPNELMFSRQCQCHLHLYSQCSLKHLQCSLKYLLCSLTYSLCSLKHFMSFVLFPKITSRSLYFLSVYIVGYIPKTRVLFSPSNKLVQGTLNPGVGSFVATISTTPVYKTTLSVSQKKMVQAYKFTRSCLS